MRWLITYVIVMIQTHYCKTFHVNILQNSPLETLKVFPFFSVVSGEY